METLLPNTRSRHQLPIHTRQNQGDQTMTVAETSYSSFACLKALTNLSKSSPLNKSCFSCSCINLFTQNLMKYLGLSKARSSCSSINFSTWSCQSFLNECVLYSLPMNQVSHVFFKKPTRYNKHPFKDLTIYNKIQ